MLFPYNLTFGSKPTSRVYLLYFISHLWPYDTVPDWRSLKSQIKLNLAGCQYYELDSYDHSHTLP